MRLGRLMEHKMSINVLLKKNLSSAELKKATLTLR